MENRDLKVLILEDQESDALLMAHELRKAGYLVAWRRVDTEQAFLEGLDCGNYQVILSDYTLPSFNARRALQLFRARMLDIPFIVVTGSLGEEQAVELMRMGASDYLIKDRLARLGGAVSAALEQKRLHDDNREALERLKNSEERYRRIVENSPDVLFRYRMYPDQGYDYFSPAIEGVTGYKPEDFYADESFAFRVVHPDDLLVLKELFSVERVKHEPYVLRWIHKDGSIVWTEQRNVPVLDQDGKLIAVEGIARDITKDILHTREREAIIALLSALREAITRADVLPVLLEKAAELVNAEGAAVTSAGGDRDIVHIELSSGCWEAWQGTDLSMGEELYQRLVVNQEAVDTTQAQDQSVQLPDALQSWQKGLISVPLVAQGKQMGILWAVRRSDGSLAERGMDYLKTLVAIGDIAASALHRAKLFEETQQRIKHLTALRTIDRAINASLDLHLTLNVLLDQLMNQKGIDAANVLLVDPATHQLIIAAGHSLSECQLQGVSLRIGESIAGQVVIERKLLNVPDISQYPRAYSQKAALLADGFKSYLGVPLIIKGEVLGVLEILLRTNRIFDLEWVEFFESMASQVAIAINNGELFSRLQKTNQEIVEAYDATISSWSVAMEMREIETRGHIERVVWWTLALGRDLSMPENEMIHLRRGALLHDIGKLALPDSVLLKPGALTGDELLLMRKHPVYAYEWLQPISYLRPAIAIPYSHHEAWDGSGYPLGLKGLEIPLAARIFALVDSWDALRSDKPYRRSWAKDQALQYIGDMKGVRFDPQVVEAFYELVKQPVMENDL
jgi:PAS domain S-box-containing protein